MGRHEFSGMSLEAAQLFGAKEIVFQEKIEFQVVIYC